MKLRGEWKRKIYGDEERYNINKVYVCCPADLVERAIDRKHRRTAQRRGKRVAAEKKLLDTIPLSVALMKFPLLMASMKRSFESINSSFAARYDSRSESPALAIASAKRFF
jgi:hypothetical protein